MRSDLRGYVRSLLDHFGPQGWWPAETPFEVMVGAVLTQNTTWGNAERAIATLGAAGALVPAVMSTLAEERLRELVRPAGYFRRKARVLLDLAAWLVDRFGGDAGLLRGGSAEQLRHELLGIRGVGAETADSILLYAAGVPIFVVDAYTLRVLARHGVLPPGADYDSVRRLARAELPADADYLGEAHALFVAVGKRFCLKRRPLCAGSPPSPPCPLRGYLPAGGPA